jgi:prevent-host-death family protein
MRIAMHEFKSGLSRYIAQARAGEVIEVTSHDKPVARLIGIPATHHDGVARLLASGRAQWAGGKPATGQAITLGPGRLLSDIVQEDRG